MALRQVTKQDSHFVVRYECDNKCQIRTAGFIKANGKIKVDEVYDVQWGNRGQVDRAVVIASGSELEMRQRLQEELTAGDTTKSKKTKQPKGTSSRPAAKVIPVCSPPGFYPAAAVSVSGDSMTVTVKNTPASLPVSATSQTYSAADTTTTTAINAVMAAATTTASETTTSMRSTTTAVSTPVTASPTTPRQDFTLRAGRNVGQVGSHLHALDARLNAVTREVEKLKKQGEMQTRLLHEILGNQQKDRELLEVLLAKVNDLQDTSGPTSVNRLPPPPSSSTEMIGDENIPPEFHIEQAVLRDMAKESNSAGNFASHLTRRFFPELFGAASLRYQYNWFGGGVLKKKELCRVRKNLIRKHVTFFFPETADESVFRDSVVPKVNETLRRISREERKRKRDAPNEEMNDMSFTGFVNLLSL